MSEQQDGPKRTTTEPTLVIPKEALPPAGVAAPEVEKITLEEHIRRKREAPTLVPCPWCEGCGMVTHEKRQAWLGAYAELEAEEVIP